MSLIRKVTAWACALAGLAFLGLFAGRLPGVEGSSRSAYAERQGKQPPRGAESSTSKKEEKDDMDQAEEDFPIFVGALAAGWQDWSWATHQIPSPDVTYEGKPAIRMEPSGWKGLYLHHDSFLTRGYQALSFAVHGGSKGGQKLAVCALDSRNQFGVKVDVAPFCPGGKLPAGAFAVCRIPLEKLQASGTWSSGICFQDASGGTQPALYLANVRLVTGRKPAPAGPVAVTVDAHTDIGPISPFIYGMAQPGQEHFKALRLPIWRWGGNPASRYNWERGNCWNAAHDWQYRNGNYSQTSELDRRPSGVADQGIARAKGAGADTILTIPTLGWVARDDNTETKSEGVPSQGGPPIAPGSDAIAGYDPAANRKHVSIRSLPRKGRPFQDPPDLTDDAVYQDEWVNHLVHKFGRASEGGVKFYAMDNEPDLWDSTHTDMHPVQPNYDELLQQFLTYARAVKDVDPTAQILGPTSWGWTGYFFSPRDRGADLYKSYADRKAHGDVPFVPWFLQQVAAHDRKSGRRTLDWLDVHFYPQAGGIYGGGTDPQTNALRLRSVRALWDPRYKDESWIGTEVQLIPRLRQWVQKYYPGTKIAINEWNWGAEGTLNGGLAAAEALGVFGRERLDMACYWTAPPVGSPAFFAFKMFRNPDGYGQGFGDVAVQATSGDPGRVSCYASRDARTGRPILLLINKSPREQRSVALKIESKEPVTAAEGFRYDGSDLKQIVRTPSVRFQEGKAQITLPPYSLLLLRCRH